MACLGGQIGFSGRTLEEINCQSRRSGMTILDDGRRRWRCPGLCSDSLRITAKCAVSSDATLRLARLDARRKSGKKKPVISPQIDKLMKQSVCEIVKNINKAPFLVHLYSEDGDDDGDSEPANSPLRMVIEKSSSENWPFITQRWEGGSPTPNGVILVQELGNEDDLGDDEQVQVASSSAHCRTSNGRSAPSSTKVWGLLVQGRGVSCPACFILKTCRVQCCYGFTTHFSLAKIDCFGMSTDFHLNRMWLQR